MRYYAKIVTYSNRNAITAVLVTLNKDGKIKDMPGHISADRFHVSGSMGHYRIEDASVRDDIYTSGFEVFDVLPMSPYDGDMCDIIPDPVGAGYTIVKKQTEA